MKQVYRKAFVVMILCAMTVGMSMLVPKDAAARHCAAIIYEHANYQGQHQCLQEGSYNVGDLDIGNDTLSSIKVSSGNTVILFEHKNYSGRRSTITHDYKFVGERWNDIVSSIIVE
ncbi:MAG: peptidase inhibitor family I36 protein [Desulfovibrio sp.]